MSLFKFDEELTRSLPEDVLDIGEYDPNTKVLSDKDEIKNCVKVDINQKLFKKKKFKDFKNCGPRDFELLSVLGKGGYGKVYLARKITGHNKGHMYAMKVLRKAQIYRNRKVIDHTKSERHILETIKHPFIVTLMYAFQTDDKLYLIMEYLSGGEIFMQLEKNGSLTEKAAKFYIAEVIMAIDHLHNNGIIYRDLKPENIMLTDKGHIKLTDFGLSKEYIYADRITNTFCGTIEYMAPEILTKTGHGIPADWWSVGAVLYDMLTGQPPFVHGSREKTIQLILKGKITMHHFLSEPARDLILKLLQRNPSNRIGCGPQRTRDVYEHPFFSDINWNKLLNLEIDPPYVPPIKGPTDTCMFDKIFTSMPIIETPCNDDNEPFHDDAFNGFSYIAPSLLYDCASNSSQCNLHTAKSFSYLDQM